MRALPQWSEVPSLARSLDRVPDDLDAVVERRLRRLLRHAATTVPWYRRLFAEAGIDPARAGLDALRRLPITRKKDWKAQSTEEFRSTAVAPEHCRLLQTSGTTGVPVRIPYTAWDRAVRRVGTQRAFAASGVGLRDRYAWIRAAERHPPAPRWHERVGLLRTRYVDLWSPPDRYWDHLLAWAPRGLIGQPLEVESVAAWVADGRLRRPPAPVLCCVHGEPLEPATRALIEASLGPVRDQYGTTEGGTVGWECGQGRGLHVNADLVIVELLKDGVAVPPGTPGEVTITNLNSWAMPIIRYGQEDLGWEIPGPCPCGRPGPLMRFEPGIFRRPFTLPSGRRVGVRFFLQVLSTLPWLVYWEVEQPEPDRFRFTLTTSRVVPAEEMDRIADRVVRGCWEPVRVEIRTRLEE